MAWCWSMCTAEHRCSSIMNSVKDSSVLVVAGIALAMVLSATTPASLSAATASKSSGPVAGPPDPYLWLEDINGAKALAWVRQQDARTLERLESQPTFDKLYRDALTVL